MSAIEIVRADFSLSSHREFIIELLNEYACDPMGGGEALSHYCKDNLVSELAKRKNSIVVMAFDGQRAVALTICFEGFSTFQCKPLLNIHDVMVCKDYRGKGISKLMLMKVEELAYELGCSKLTLEVLEGNKVAQSAYLSLGFSGYELSSDTGKALFWEKKLGKKLGKKLPGKTGG